MGTHDEATEAYFADTSVKCILVPRQKTDGVMANTFVSCCYTHHQKTVICDAAFEEDESMRRIVAFIGGLDITNGRYDTPEFSLFKTIKTNHVDDFYQNCVPGATEKTGPREPWHDIHGKVEGPIALDIKKIIVFPFEGLESRSDILDFLISLSKLNLSVLRKSNLPVGLL